jgi:hypothetical protein
MSNVSLRRGYGVDGNEEHRREEWRDAVEEARQEALRAVEIALAVALENKSPRTRKGRLRRSSTK